MVKVKFSYEYYIYTQINRTSIIWLVIVMFPLIFFIDYENPSFELYKNKQTDDLFSLMLYMKLYKVVINCDA